MTSMSVWTHGRTALSMAAVVTLVACGGGGGSTSASSAAGSTSLNGVAGTGAPMVKAAVTISCQSGAATTTTDANGAFSVTFATLPVGPCAIKAVATDGSGAEIVHYSLLDTVSAGTSNKANINPATTVVAGEVVNGDPERFFNGSAPLATITPAAVALAITHVQQLVGTSVDPLKGVYVADKTNELDQKFDQLKIEWNPANTSVTVTSKVTGAVVGTVRIDSFDTDKTAYLTRLTDPAVVPTTAPGFAALDTQFGAGLNAALAGSDKTALNALIDSAFLDGGLSRANIVDELWSSGRGAAFGKFSVLDCANTDAAPAGTDHDNKVACLVAAPVTLPDGERDFFEFRVIEKTPGTWLAWGDQRRHRVEVRTTAIKSVRFDGGTVDSPYRSGLQIWIPLPVGASPDYEAAPNDGVAKAEVYIGSDLIAHLRTCGSSDYLELSAAGGCVGNFMPLLEEEIAALTTNFNSSKAMPVVTLKLFDGSDVLLGSYDVKLEALPVPVADFTDPTKPYQANFATLTEPSVSALLQSGAVAQPLNLAWTAGVSIDDLGWNARSSSEWAEESFEVAIDATAVSFTPPVLNNVGTYPVTYRSLYMTSRNSEGRKYWTKYFACDGGPCY